MLKRAINWMSLAVVTGALLVVGAGCGDGGSGAGSAPPLDESKLTTTASGLKYSTITPGSGKEVQKGNRVKVHYTGWLASNGAKFDSSRDRGTPFEFQVGANEVIAGWEEGVKGMKIGEKLELIVPPTLGYGEGGNGAIPPNATLRFQVELVAITGGPGA